MKYLGLLFLMIFTAVVDANETKGACKKLDTFFPYKAGIEAERASEVEYAFDIFCNLAFKGDYRAQFKLAQYYNSGIKNYIEQNQVFALVWAKIANTKILTRRKSDFISQLMNQLPESQLVEVDGLYATAIRSVPTGIRVDMKYKPIDLQKILEEHNKKKSYTGTRIKRSEPPPGLGIIK